MPELSRLRPLIVAVAILVFPHSFASQSRAGVSYQDPTGGWRYSYGGTFNAGMSGFSTSTTGGTGIGPAGYGTPSQTQALDGTWRDDQASKWDGSGIGDTQNAGNASTQKSPGGISALTEGSTSFIRMQDTGNPESWGFVQGATRPINSDRRLYFGHQISNDGPLPSQLVMDNGITISFRARIPDPTTTTMDPIYPDSSDKLSGLTSISPWGTVGGGGYPIADSGRGMFNVVQNDPSNFNTDSGLGFSLITSKDRALYAPASPVLGGPGTGGLIMNNLNGNTPTGEVDTFSPGTLNLLPMTDQQLYSWNEFWITIQSDPSHIGTNLVNVYLDGSLSPTTFHVTASGDNTMEYVNNAWISMGLSDTALFGSVDVDFFNYSLGVLTPAAAAPVLVGDVNHDGIVNSQDLALISSSWLATGSNLAPDVNGDGIVNSQDLALVSSNWLATAGSGNASAVPEPATLVLIGCGALVWLCKRSGLRTVRR